MVAQGQAHSTKSAMKNSKLVTGEYWHSLGEKHRLTNFGDCELVVIEVQVGGYHSEDDIVRIDDIYERV